MLSWGVVFIVIVASMVFGISYYGYNNMEYLSKADWLVVSSGLATLLGTVLSGITAIYGFLNKKEIKKLKQELAVYDLDNEIEIASQMRQQLADYDYIFEYITNSEDTTYKIEYCEKIFNTLKNFEKIESVSKMKKFKKLKEEARNRKIFIELDNAFFINIKFLKIPRKSNLNYLLDILEKIEGYNKK